MGLILRMQDLFDIQKSISVIHHINKLKKNHMAISIDAGNAFNKIQYPFMISKMLSKLKREGIFFDLLKVIYKNLQLTVHSMGERLNSFSLRSGAKEKTPALTTPIQCCTGSPSQFNKGRKIKDIQIRIEMQNVICRLHDCLHRIS